MDNTNNLANGSLMRNGFIPALFSGKDQEIEALDATILHGIITHYGPLMVICCVIHTFLIRRALLTNWDCAPTIDDIKNLLAGPWIDYQSKTQNPFVQAWLKEMGTTLLEQQEKRLIEELQDFETFDPWHYDYRGKSGYCILTLKISLWALYWSFKDFHPPIPKWLPEWIFEKHGFDTVMWVVSIGADADTYGATTGPLLAAFHPNINQNFLIKLEVRDEVLQLVSK